jgi:hypothetical protein
MSSRAVVALALVAGLLLGYVILFERSSATSKELGERKGRVLVSFVRDKVERLEVERQGKRVVLERKPAAGEGELRSFRVVAPFQAAADSDTVDRLLGELEWLSARRTLEPLSSQDEKSFGLDAPRYRIAYTIGRARHVLELGKTDVHGESVYARLDREPRAYVVPKTVLDVLQSQPADYRDKQLVSELTVAWVRKVVLTAEGATTQLSKEGDRWWLSLAPRGYGDGRRIEQLLHALSELRAARYLEPSEHAQAEAALAKPAVRIEVQVVPDEAREDKRPSTLTLVLGGACGVHADERYARTLPSGPPACVKATDLAALTPNPSDLRELRVLIAEPSSVERIELAQAEKIAVKREGEKWQPDGGPTGAVDRESVEAWLQAMSKVRALRVESRPFEARGSVTFGLGGDKLERVAVAAPDAREELSLKRGDEPLTHTFSAELTDLLSVFSGRFAPLEVWAAHQPSEVQKVEASDRGRTRGSKLEDGRWRGEGVDSERTRELVRALLDLRAHLIVTDRARPAHGFTPGAPNVKLTLTSGRTLSLEIGAPTSDGVYARVNSERIIEIGRDIPPLIAELAGGPRAAPEPAPADELDHGDHEDHAH